jgi:ATP-dependent protease ClpP protease subunit
MSADEAVAYGMIDEVLTKKSPAGKALAEKPKGKKK